MYAYTIHPGELIADELEARGRSQSFFAQLIGKTRQEVNHLITGRRDLNTERAVRIANAFDTEPELWINMQSTYDLQMLQADDSLRSSLSQITTRRLALSPIQTV